MCKKVVLMSLLLLFGLAGSVSAVVVMLDDFESYNPDAFPGDSDSIDVDGAWQLNAVWKFLNPGWTSEGVTFAMDLSEFGGVGGSQAMITTALADEGGRPITHVADKPNEDSDWSGGKTLRVWQKGIIETGDMSLDNLTWRITMQAGSFIDDGGVEQFYWYQTYLSTPTEFSTAFSMNGVWGGGANGGYVDIPLSPEGYGDGTGDDDWVWEQTAPFGINLLPGDPDYVAPDLTYVPRLMLTTHAWKGDSNGGVYSVIWDDLQLIAPDTDPDFDGDTDVDGADFLIWQRGSGSSGTQRDGDANGDGAINGDDLTIWGNQFGNSQALAATVGVPEPSSIILSILLVGGGLGPRTLRAFMG